MNWYSAAMFCMEAFGSFVDMEERFFICPECGEPIYECDWDYHNFSCCPVCEVCWEDIA